MTIPTPAELLSWDTSAAPVISTMLIMAKRVLPKAYTHWIPLLAMAMGIGYALTARPGCHFDPSCAAAGMQIGLMAVGLHSTIKSAAERHQKVVTP